MVPFCEIALPPSTSFTLYLGEVHCLLETYPAIKTFFQKLRLFRKDSEIETDKYLAFKRISVYIRGASNLI